MAAHDKQSRRQFVRKLALGATLAPLAMARLTTSRAADLPLLSPDDPAAKKVKYTEDASSVKKPDEGQQLRDLRAVRRPV